MAYHDRWSAASTEEGKVTARYMYAPGIGVTLTAAPRDHWSTEKAGNAAEVKEYSLAMVKLLFEQLTPETQRESLAMCKALASGDTDAAEIGGAADV